MKIVLTHKDLKALLDIDSRNSNIKLSQSQVEDKAQDLIYFDYKADTITYTTKKQTLHTFKYKGQEQNLFVYKRKKALFRW